MQLRNNNQNNGEDGNTKKQPKSKISNQELEKEINRIKLKRNKLLKDLSNE